MYVVLFSKIGQNDYQKVSSKNTWNEDKDDGHRARWARARQA